MIIPTILEKWNQGSMVSYDIFSRLLKDRIIFFGDPEGAVSTASANTVIAQLLYLDAEDPEKEINLYINSPVKTPGAAPALTGRGAGARLYSCLRCSSTESMMP